MALNTSGLLRLAPADAAPAAAGSLAAGFVFGPLAALAALAGRLTAVRLAAAASAFLVAAFLADCALKPRYPRSLPRVGYGDSVWATLRNWLGYVFYFNAWVDEGYHKYSKQDRAFVVPSAASRPQEIVVPRSQTAWLLGLPDHVASAHAAHDDVLYTRYNFLFDAHAHARAWRRTHGAAGPPADEDFHFRVVHRNLARHLPGLLPAIEDEVAAAVDAAFGGPSVAADADADADDPPWRTVNLWDAWLAMVPPVTNRLLVGPGACRSPPLLQALVRFADSVVTNSFLLNMVPKLLHPLVGRLVSIPNRRLWRRAHRLLEPVIHERLQALSAASAAAGDASPPAASEDYITWHIRMARAEGRAAELDPVAISKRLLPVEFAAIHTTVMTGFFVFLDLLTADPAQGVLDAIRDEVAAVRASLRTAAGTATAAAAHWDKPALARLWRTDSAIRESMRASHFATSLVKRKVVAPGGVTNAAEGWHAPCGSLLMLNLAGTHHDPALYDAPDRYDAFRYARLREQYDREQQQPQDAAACAQPPPALRGSMLGMVTTSDRHLAFGHGRHACPGRFFVAHELKMILAYFVTNYEARPLEARPRSLWIGQTIIPPLGVKIQVRRRKQA